MSADGNTVSHVASMATFVCTGSVLALERGSWLCMACVCVADVRELGA